MKAVHYSVPDYLVDKLVDVKVYSEKIVIFYEGNKVATHQRKYIPGDWKIDIEHFIATFTRKPGALASSVALRQASEQIRDMFNRCFKESPRDFIMLLHHKIENNLDVEDILDAFYSLKEKGIKQPSADQIKLKIASTTEYPISEIDDYDSVDFKQIESTSVQTLNTLTDIMNNKVLITDNREIKNGAVIYSGFSPRATSASL